MAGYYTVRLIAKFANLGRRLPDDVRVHRLQPGPGGRAMGAWLWCFESDSMPLVNRIGSQWTVLALARAESLDLVEVDRDCHIYPRGAPHER